MTWLAKAWNALRGKNETPYVPSVGGGSRAVLDAQITASQAHGAEIRKRLAKALGPEWESSAQRDGDMDPITQVYAGDEGAGR